MVLPDCLQSNCRLGFQFRMQTGTKFWRSVQVPQYLCLASVLVLHMYMGTCLWRNFDQRHHSSINHGCLRCHAVHAPLIRTIGLCLEKKSPSLAKGWQKRWFVFDRCGKVQYYAEQADERAYGMAKESGEKSGERLKGAFSLRDCTRFSTPKRELSILVYKHQPIFKPRLAPSSPVPQ